MASKTYRADFIVCKKTKLKESDLIITGLANDGSLLKAVAKGARKPTSSLSSRLEIGNECHALLVEGKSLDIITECSLTSSPGALWRDYAAVIGSAPIAEFACIAAVEDLPNPKLFELTRAAFAAIETTSDTPLKASIYCTISLAYLLKGLAFSGFKPSFIECIGCGEPIAIEQALQNHTRLAFSSIEGGAVCKQCVRNFETISISAADITWLQTLLYSTFDTVRTFELDAQLQRELIQIEKMLIDNHLQTKLHSLEYLLQNPL